MSGARCAGHPAGKESEPGPRRSVGGVARSPVVFVVPAAAWGAWLLAGFAQLPAAGRRLLTEPIPSSRRLWAANDRRGLCCDRTIDQKLMGFTRR